MKKYSFLIVAALLAVFTFPAATSLEASTSIQISADDTYPDKGGATIDHWNLTLGRTYQFELKGTIDTATLDFQEGYTDHTGAEVWASMTGKDAVTTLADGSFQFKAITRKIRIVKGGGGTVDLDLIGPFEVED